MLPRDFTIHNRYRLNAVVDERPGSTVYRGRDDQTGRFVLVAALPVEGDAAREDMELAARQIATVDHEALLPVTDHFAEDQRYYLVCDDPGGQDLERTLRMHGGPLPEAESLPRAVRLLGAIEHLHNQRPQLFLGEPTPSDLWIGEDGAWYLTPFALVRPIGHTSSPYRAPELADRDTDPTPVSDLYAVSALLYHALTGTPPTTAEQQNAGAPLIGPRTLNPALSALVEQALLRGLQLRPVNRYQVAREMRLALETVQVMGARPPGVGPDVMGAPPPLAPPAQTGIYPTPVRADSVGAPAQPSATEATVVPAPQRGLSTGCMVAIAVVLTLLALGICVAGILVLVPGAPLNWLMRASDIAPFPTDVQPEPTAALPATPLPTAPPAQIGPRAITLQNAAQITQTREITGAVLGPVAYAPDGKILAVGISNVISLRDANSLDEFTPPRRFEGHTNQVFTLAWSPDSKLLASGAINENSIRLWSLSDGRLVRQLEGHTNWIRAVAFSPDGKMLASGSFDQTVRLWDVASGSLLRTLTGHTGFISTIAFTPDGKTLASSSSDGTARSWDVATGAPRTGFTFESPLNPTTKAHLWATGLAFSIDGKTLAVGLEDGSIAIADAATGTTRRTLTGHSSIVVSRGVQFAPDGKTLASASFDGTVRLWDVTSGTQSAELKGHVLRVLSLSFSPDGQRLASTSDQGGQLIVWDVKQSPNSKSFLVGQGLVVSLVFSPDGAVLGAVGYNGVSRLNLLDQNRYRTISGLSAANKSLAFLSANRIVSITDQGALVILGATDSDRKTLEGLDGRPLNVVTSSDGKLIVAASSTGAIGRWDGATGAAQPAIKSQKLQSILVLAVSPDGGLIAVSGLPDASQIEIWDAATGKLRQTLTGGSTAITNLAFQPRGQELAATDAEGKLWLWSAQDGKLIKSVSATQQQRGFSALTFSPDGTMLVTGSPNGEIVFWNAQTGEQVAVLPLGDFGVFAVAFSPDGQRLALGLADQTVRMFELPGK